MVKKLLSLSLVDAREASASGIPSTDLCVSVLNPIYFFFSFKLNYHLLGTTKVLNWWNKLPCSGGKYIEELV